MGEGPCPVVCSPDSVGFIGQHVDYDVYYDLFSLWACGFCGLGF